MGVNCARKYAEFEKEMKGIREEYLTAGFSEEAFLEYYMLRKKELSRDIAYEKRKLSLNYIEEGFKDEARSSLLKGYLEQMSTEMKLPSIHKYWWIDHIENERLLHALLSFSDYELELIDLSVYQEVSQREISQIMGKKPSSISKRLKVLRKRIEESLSSNVQSESKADKRTLDWTKENRYNRSVGQHSTGRTFLSCNHQKGEDQ